ncbi:MFS general substrate transporter [Rhizodiscina lignyota]|uniref:MFS general substrate transporter n=1 Tax=Rhizodiscina lignyota TaxID=1504668 RepID=A0A9P4ITN4_9PEZI|nr:MFS general substrate transporter [Rhizodiscina lignyota]
MSPGTAVTNRHFQEDEPNTYSSFELGTELQSIPEPDGGRQAWLVLAGCAVIQAPVWGTLLKYVNNFRRSPITGFGLAFGVLQQYYASHSDELRGDVKSVPIIGTTATGILYCCSPLTFAVLSRWPKLRRFFGPVGLAISTASLIASTFVSSVSALIATQGVLNAIGCGLLFAPTTLYLDEWFIRRKGIAYGLMWAGKSLDGAVFPFIMDFMLRSLGWKNTLRIWAAAMFALTAPLLFFLRPRIPISQSTRPRPLSLTFLRHKDFWMLEVGNIMQSFGYFLPQTFLSSYAVSLGTSPMVGAAILAIFNATSICGNIGIGILNDHMAVTSVVLFSSIGSAIAVFLLWGFTSQVALLIMYAIVYGVFAGGYSSTWSGIQTHLKRKSSSTDTGLVFGLLAGGRGIGNVISGPLSVALLTSDNWMHTGRSWAFNSEYGPLILFTGATALCGACGSLLSLGR